MQQNAQIKLIPFNLKNWRDLKKKYVINLNENQFFITFNYHKDIILFFNLIQSALKKKKNNINKYIHNLFLSINSSSLKICANSLMIGINIFMN